MHWKPHCVLNVPTCRHLWAGVWRLCIFISPAQITPMHRMKAPKVWKEKEMFVKKKRKLTSPTLSILARRINLLCSSHPHLQVFTIPTHICKSSQFPSTSASLQDATLLGQFNNVPYQHIHIDNGVKYLVDEKSKTITTTNNSDVFTNINTSFYRGLKTSKVLSNYITLLKQPMVA